MNTISISISISILKTTFWKPKQGDTAPQPLNDVACMSQYWKQNLTGDWWNKALWKSSITDIWWWNWVVCWVLNFEEFEFAEIMMVRTRRTSLLCLDIDLLVQRFPGTNRKCKCATNIFLQISTVQFIHKCWIWFQGI